ncbi:SdpC family antimicrobial peptide [Nocardiopsis terrae]|uniref:SdpC family antimicrobial peptide n=1 Tax=Nocardiopsis terrae TaxID=372655 RepID=A0ABR9HNC6_9ACTN|nr:hypothetical protein [Nocardiopsis terrae]MBE1460496.1 SdpC family antimicrobial peptide [Nocardiopsis terrae]
MSTSAFADTTPPVNSNASGNESRAELIQNTEEFREAAHYSQEEILQLLLAGQGPIAEAHPDLLDTLGFSPEKPHTDEEALDQLISDYLTYEKDFEEKVAVPVRTGDPQKVEAALVALSESFMGFLDASADNTGSSPTAAGWTYQGVNVAIYANAVGVVNVAGYTNAGVATLALATLAVVTLYLEDEDASQNGFEKQHVINELTEAMAS